MSDNRPAISDAIAFHVRRVPRESKIEVRAGITISAVGFVSEILPNRVEEVDRMKHQLKVQVLRTIYGDHRREFFELLSQLDQLGADSERAAERTAIVNKLAEAAALW
jgi:hypothetical protein